MFKQPTGRQEKRKRRNKHRKPLEKSNNPADLSSYLSVTTLNINGLNTKLKTLLQWLEKI